MSGFMDFDDLSAMDEPGAGMATFGPHAKPHISAWAYCRGGFVAAIALAPHGAPHPFGLLPVKKSGLREDPTGEWAVNVTGVHCGVGHILDGLGNVAPAAGRTVPLTPEQPAYHAQAETAAPSASDVFRMLSR